MVKLDSNFKSRTTLSDSLKISSPKVRDDPFGSSSPLITSVCPDQSNFRGSIPESPVLSSSHCATLASMVIARKVGCYCYTGKANLYAWNSFTLEDFSSALVHRMADLVMNSYLSFPGLVELIVPPEVVLAYGSLPRPPENCFFRCSWCIYSDLRVLQSSSHVVTHLSNMKRNGHFTAVVQLAMFLFINVLQRHASQGEFSPKPACSFLKSSYDATTVTKFTLTLLKFGLLWCKLGCTLIELSQDTGDLISQTSRHHQFVGKFIVLKASHATHLFADSSFLHFLKTDSRFVSAYWLSKQHDVVYRRSEDAIEYTSLTTASWELYWSCNLLRNLHMVASVLFFSDDQAALCSLNKLVYHELLLQQILPQIIRQRHSSMLLVCSGWFMFILDFLYGSLPRPPDIFLI